MPTQTNSPLISVVMPVYNTERYVDEAIASILNQTYRNLELIVIDDGSTDNSADIVCKLAEADHRIRLRRLPHQGLAEALNTGVADAQGEFIALMDSDDIAVPERLTVQMEHLSKTGDDICGGCAQIFGGRGQLLWFPSSHDGIRTELLFRTAMLPSTVLSRADVLKQNPYTTSLANDHELWTRLSSKYRMSNVPRLLAHYRSYPEQCSQVNASKESVVLTMRRRQYLSTLFPEATDDDGIAIEHLARKLPHLSLTELAIAGKWLVRFANGTETWQNQMMAERWAAACYRSAGLGLGCYQLYRKVAEEFNPSSANGSRNLWIRCAMRLPSESKADRVIGKLVRRGREQLASTA